MAKLVLNHDYQAQKYGWNCGPTSTRCAISTRGVFIDQDRIIREINAKLPKKSWVDDDGTDYVDLLLPILRQYGKAQYYSTYIRNKRPTKADVDTLWDRMRGSLAAGYGCVANIVADPGFNPPGYPNYRIWHYIAIVGFDDAGRKFYVADSANFSGINHYWLPVEQLARLIGNEGKGYACAPAVLELDVKAITAFKERFMAAIGSDVRDIERQLGTWPQLGGRTLTDGIAAVLEALDA